MKISTSSRISASVVSFLFVLTIVLLLVISGYSDSSMPFDGSKPEYSVPIVELLTRAANNGVSAHDEVRAVSSSEYRSSTSSTDSFADNLRSRNRNVVREDKKLEQGLARARAAIRKATSLQNLSTIVSGHEVPAGHIYRNPGAFYQTFKKIQ